MSANGLGMRLAIGTLSLLFLTSAWGICSSRSTYFVVNNDSVYDAKTDLTWMRCSFGQTWTPGLGCVGIPYKIPVSASFRFHHLEWTDASGRSTTGWRVPGRDELLSIVNHDCPSGFGSVPMATIDHEIFPDTPVEYFLAHAPGDSRSCELISFIDGRGIEACGGWQGSVFPLRLVRSGR